MHHQCLQHARKLLKTPKNYTTGLIACTEPLHGSKSIQNINDSAWREKKQQLHGTIRGHNLESFFEEFLAVAEMRNDAACGHQDNLCNSRAKFSR